MRRSSPASTRHSQFARERQKPSSSAARELYRLALPRADRLLITEIDFDFDGDTTFPAPDPARWREAARDHHAPTEERPFAVDYVEYVTR